MIPPRPRPQRPALRPVRPGEGRGGQAFELKHLLLLAGVLLTGLHVVLSRAELEMPARVLLAFPLYPLLWETNRFARSDPARREIPANAVGLFYYYMAFSFPAFFHIEFFDMNGPVTFTDESRLLGAVAVAFGSIMVYAGMRLGERLGDRVRPVMVRFAPPVETPEGFFKAVMAYVVICLIATQILINIAAFPTSVAVLIAVTICFEIAIGITLAKPELFRGKWTKHTGLVLLFFGGAAGLLRGILDPIMRLGVTSLSGRWAYTRRISFALIGSLLAIYLVFQPIKHDFRAQVWQRRGDDTAGYVERLQAWGQAFSNFWSADSSSSSTGSDATDSAIARLAELDAVNHAFLMLPGQVQYLDGSGWSTIFTSLVPRIIWRDKPMTADLEQRYGVVFHRQNELSARSTAILLPLIVDGYWNFGWPGIAFACAMMGLWVGACQRTFSGPHWALQAMGIAHLARLIAQGSLTSLYSSLFQQIVGFLLATWAVYGMALLFTTKRAPVRKPFGGPSRFAAR